MPKLTPEYLEGPQPPSEQRFDAADALRVHEGIGLPGQEQEERMGVTSSPEAETKTWDKIIANSLASVQNLTREPTPELAEFYSSPIDFDALESGFEAYEAAGLKPELVIFPLSFALEDWKEIYSNLRKWQDKHPQDIAHRLKKIFGNDGLAFSDEVEQNWPAITLESITSPFGEKLLGPDGTPWKAIVVPTANAREGSIALNTSWMLNRMPDALKNQASVIGMSDLTPQRAHMPLSAYLTLQGIRLMSNREVIDDGGVTWNAGCFFIEVGEDSEKRAPVSCWSAADGMVDVSDASIHKAAEGYGVRLPVWDNMGKFNA